MTLRNRDWWCDVRSRIGKDEREHDRGRSLERRCCARDDGEGHILEQQRREFTYPGFFFVVSVADACGGGLLRSWCGIYIYSGIRRSLRLGRSSSPLTHVKLLGATVEQRPTEGSE